MHRSIYTVGHSTHSLDKLLSLLSAYNVNAVADVRSTPFSRLNPQFNLQALRNFLNSSSLAYAFLGRELGARPNDRSCYIDGKVQYSRLADTTLFHQGLDRIILEMEDHNIALLCAEKDPLTCHRAILIARHLTLRGISVQHILADGTLESHEQAVDRLLIELGMEELDLFRSQEDTIAEAFRLRGEQIAFVETAPVDPQITFASGK